MKVLLVSATPSPSASRNSVMRLALGTPAPALILRQPVDEALDADAALLRRGVALGDQHVAVRQHIDRARMVEPGREGCDRHAIGGGRLGAVGPAVDGSDIDRRDPRMFRRRQGRRRTIALRHGRGVGRSVLGVVAGGQRQRQCGDADGQEDVLAHGRSLGDLAFTMLCRPERSCGRHEFHVKRSERPPRAYVAGVLAEMAVPACNPAGPHCAPCTWNHPPPC